MGIPNNLKAFLAAFALVTVLSLALVQTGVIGGDSGGSALAGDPSTHTPAVLPASETPAPVTAVPTAAAPTPSPTPGPPIAAPIDVPIFMYHQVLPELPADEFDAALTVTNAALDEQLSYLACAGYTPITMQQLFDAFDGRAALPQKPVILAFDDGWADHYANAFPILQAHGMVGSFAIVTGLVDAGGPYMTWSQIEEMSAAGMEMTSHTVSHIDLGTSDDATDVDQITTSKADIESHTGKTVDYFVYPAGEPFRSGTEERQQQVVQMLIDAGYRGALLAGPNDVTQDPNTPYALNRVRVSGGEDIYTYAGSIYGPSPDEVGCP